MKSFYISCFLIATFFVKAQTETDAIMMDKNNICIGPMYQNSNWTNYWEGTQKRENLNIGKITTNSYNLMGNYGIKNNLNLIFNASYVATKASAGTLMGQKGFQDFSMFLKYMPIEKVVGKSIYSLYGIIGFSIPMTNYPADYLPLSIGLQSKTTTFRLMGDYQRGNFFTTISGAYIFRSNITIDRNAYYTTDYHYTNQVFMPNQVATHVKMGYRSSRLIAETNFESLQTLAGGFDISSNNMPFPSNTMNFSKIGVYAKYNFTENNLISIIAGYNQVIGGRNIGQSSNINLGLFCVLDLKKNKKS